MPLFYQVPVVARSDTKGSKGSATGKQALRTHARTCARRALKQDGSGSIAAWQLPRGLAAC